MTGTGCPVGNGAETNLVPDPVPPGFHTTSPQYIAEARFFTSAGDFAGGTVGHDGSWTMTAAVGMVPSGRASLGGYCTAKPDGDGVIDFQYPSVSVTVASPFRLDIEPSTMVKAGTRLTVNSVGGKCPMSSGSSPQVNLFSGRTRQWLTVRSPPLLRADGSRFLSCRRG